MTGHTTRIEPDTTTGGLPGHRYRRTCGTRGRVYLRHADAEARAATHEGKTAPKEKTA